jgi:hypothetical protein
MGDNHFSWRIRLVLALLVESSAADCPMATTGKYDEPSLAGCHRAVKRLLFVCRGARQPHRLKAPATLLSVAFCRFGLV